MYFPHLLFTQNLCLHSWYQSRQKDHSWWNSKDLTNRAIKAILQNWFKAPWKFKCVFYYVSLSYFKERRKENKIGSFKSEGWRIRNEICARLPFYRFLYTYLMRVYFTFVLVWDFVCIVTGKNVENCNDERKYCAKMIRLIGVETRGKIIVKYYQDSLITLSTDVYDIDNVWNWNKIKTFYDKIQYKYLNFYMFRSSINTVSFLNP